MPGTLRKTFHLWAKEHHQKWGEERAQDAVRQVVHGANLAPNRSQCANMNHGARAMSEKR